MAHPTLAFATEPSNRAYRLRLARYQGLGESLAQFVRSPRAGKANEVALLDVGVGNGRTLRYCEAFGVVDQIAFHGVDNSSRRLANVYGGARWQLTQADVQNSLPFSDNRFDVVVCEQLLEHVPDPAAVVKEMVRVLVPGGLLIVGVPVFAPPLAFLRKNLVPTLDRWFGIRRDHVQAFTRNAICKLLAGIGNLTIQEVRGFRIASGGPLSFLEDYHWWYRFNRFLGHHFPSWCIEVQILANKPHAAHNQQRARLTQKSAA